jgi:tetratricopeptide (TPR) repeat protein
MTNARPKQRAKSVRTANSATRRWKAFPYTDAAYNYPGPALAKQWPRLHRGDCEPYPEPNGLSELVERHPELEPTMSIEKASAVLVEAWRTYHRGAFQEAMERGLEVGPLGYNVANRAANIYATYLESDPDKKLKILLASARRAEELCTCAESLANAWYLHAHALGRYGQGISVARALAEGLGGKVKSSLEQAIALEPRHADAHIALGAYHAAVIDKMGTMIGGLTYGASTDAAVKHFEKALKLNPHSGIARVEYASALRKMFGDAKERRATALYRDAAACSPADAMERLDVERAKSKLADWASVSS